MKIYAISDLHLCLSGTKPMDIFGVAWENYLDKIKEDWNSKVTDEDYVLMAGDMSWALSLDEAKNDLNYLQELNGNKIIIRGNHDYWWKSISALRNQLPKTIYPLQNDAIKIGKYIIAGTRGWTVPEKNKEFSAENQKLYNRDVLRLEMSLNYAKKLVSSDDDIIIAMIHFPPFNSAYEESEFTNLFEKFNVKKVIYGHLHGNSCRSKLCVVKNGIEYFLTSCDKLNNKLIEVY